MMKKYLEHLTYTDLSGKRRLRPWVRWSSLLVLVVAIVTSGATFLFGEDKPAQGLPTTDTIPVQEEKTEQPVQPEQPKKATCSPQNWQLKPVLISESGEGTAVQPVVYGLTPPCAYTAIFRTYLSAHLRTRGWLHTEINEFLGATEALHAPIDPNKLSEYRSRPANAQVLRADGIPKTIPIVYGNTLDYRLWWPSAMYIAVNYCYRANGVVPVRETPATVVCAVNRLVSGQAGRTVEQISEWTVRSTNSFSSSPLAFIDYVFVDTEGNAYLVASEFVDRPAQQVAEEMTALGEIHGTGVWLFDADGDTFELPAVANAVHWQDLAETLFNAPMDVYPLPDGWENAPIANQVPELMKYLEQQ